MLPIFRLPLWYQDMTFCHVLWGVTIEVWINPAYHLKSTWISRAFSLFQCYNVSHRKFTIAYLTEEQQEIMADLFMYRLNLKNPFHESYGWVHTLMNVDSSTENSNPLFQCLVLWKISQASLSFLSFQFWKNSHLSMPYKIFRANVTGWTRFPISELDQYRNHFPIKVYVVLGFAFALHIRLSIFQHYLDSHIISRLCACFIYPLSGTVDQKWQKDEVTLQNSLCQEFLQTNFIILTFLEHCL